jgi:HEAT repeat protein
VQQAIAALAADGGDAAHAAILKLAESPASSTRNAALGALRGMPGGELEQRELRIRTLRERGGQVALDALTSLAEDSSPAARRALVDTLGAGAILAGRAASALASRPDSQSIRAVLDFATRPNNPMLTETLNALAQNDAPEARGALDHLMHASDRRLQKAAVQAVLMRGGPEAEQLALDRHNDLVSPSEAVTVLARMESPSALERLEQLARSEPTVALAATYELAGSDPERACNLVAEQLRSPTPEVRIGALNVAQRLDEAVAVPLAIASTADLDLRVGASAIETLMQLGGPKAEAALVSILADTSRDPQLRRTAANALAELGSSAIASQRGLIDQLRSPLSTDGVDQE